MENYTRIIGETSTNIRTPTAPEIAQGNDQLTPFESAKNNGYNFEMSNQISAISAELTNYLINRGVTPNPAILTQFLDTLDADLDSVGGSNSNLVINGQGLIAQRGATFDSTTTPANSNDTYLLDRMLLLSDGNDIADISQETSIVPIGSYSAIKFDQETVNKQWGYVQILEAKDAAAIIGGTASLSFKARKGGSNATLDTLRAAIISWDSTEDVVTSDVVGTWNGAGIDPILATNWTYENTPSDLTLTTSYQTFKIENVAIDTASTKNVAVFIWLDDTDATVADTAFITDIKLEKGSIATDFVARPIDEELSLSQRYCKSYGGDSVFEELGSYGIAISSTIINTSITVPVEMRALPSLTIAGAWQISDGVGAIAATSITLFGGHASTSIIGIQGNVAGGLTTFRNYRIEAASSLSSRAILDAEF